GDGGSKPGSNWADAAGWLFTKFFSKSSAQLSYNFQLEPSSQFRENGLKRMQHEKRFLYKNFSESLETSGRSGCTQPARPEVQLEQGTQPWATPIEKGSPAWSNSTGEPWA